MCKMKPSCDEKTAYSLTYPFVVYICRNNQLQCSPLLSHKKGQPIGVRCEFGMMLESSNTTDLRGSEVGVVRAP